MRLATATVLFAFFLSRPAISPLAATRVVDPGGSGDFLTIQSAVDASQAGDTILVRPGVYPEAIYLGPPHGGVVVKGDGLVADIVVQGDAYVVVRIGDTVPAARIEGLTLSGSGLFGALWIQGARAEIVDCVIRKNEGAGSCSGVGGAGRIASSSDVLVEGCLIEDNQSWESPGGLIVWQARADIRDNVFRNNRACYGGGIEMYHCEGYGESVIEENLFVRNQADAWGGGVFNVDSSPVIRKNTFVDNGDSLKAAIWVLGGRPRIESNLLVGSHWAVYCHAELGYPASLPDIRENLCWGITGGALSNCAATAGLRAANPLFCDAPGDDFHLCADSPAVVNGVVVFGAFGVGCPDCRLNPTRQSGWGELKALYRDGKR